MIKEHKNFPASSNTITLEANGREDELMGEVRVKATLTNSSDESLERRGQLSSDKVRSYEADALVDTGAVSLVLPVFVMQKLGLMARGKRLVEYADGAKIRLLSPSPWLSGSMDETLWMKHSSQATRS